MATVLTVAAGSYETGGGNENNTYGRRTRKLDEADRVAWIATEVVKAGAAAA